MACAIRLLQLLEDDPELTERLGEVPVAVIEKGRVAGAHQLSGGVMNPSAIRELLPDDDSWPHYGEVKRETVYFMLNKQARGAAEADAAAVPQPRQLRGLASPSSTAGWARRPRRWAPTSSPRRSAHKLLVEDGTVVGVRTGDKGRDKSGGEKGNFEPGSDVIAKATVLAEGCWGHLTGAALKALDLAPKDPQVWALGVKEVWEVAQPFEKIVHTLGWPLRAGREVEGVRRLLDLRHEPRGRDAEGLDRVRHRPRLHRRALLASTTCCRSSSCTRWCSKILEDGKRVAWGAKAIPEGGYWAMPTLHAPGMVIAGDAGGMVNVPKLKGIHYAIESGRLAAETIYAQLKDGSSDFSAYETADLRLRDGQGALRVAQHEAAVRQGPDPRRRDHQRDGGHQGPLPGRALGDAPRRRGAADADRTARSAIRSPTASTRSTSSRGVFLTGNATRDDAPSHIRIQQRVPREVGEGWAWMCPAGVYEVPEDAPEEGMIDLIVNPSNCVQCGAITAKGGRLTPPEGGDGPVYQIT